MGRAGTCYMGRLEGRQGVGAWVMGSTPRGRAAASQAGEWQTHRTMLRCDRHLSGAPRFAQARVGDLWPAAVATQPVLFPPFAKHRKCDVSPPSRFHGRRRGRTRQDSVYKGLVVARPEQDNTRGSPPEGDVVPWSGALIPAKPPICLLDVVRTDRESR